RVARPKVCSAVGRTRQSGAGQTMNVRHVSRILLYAIAICSNAAIAQTAPTSQAAPDRSIAAAESIVLRDVRFVGNTVFSSDQLRAEISSYIGRRITPD